MRRTIAFVALWLLAGVGATTVAWLGVSTVRDELSGSQSHPDPLSSEEISAELAAAPTTTTLVVEPTAPSTTTTLAPASTTTTAGDPSPSTTTTTAAVAPEVRSYHLVGGDVTFRFSPAGVTVVVASPDAGYTAEIGSSHLNGKEVEFESASHKSRIDAWWDGGPQAEVREDTDD